MKHKRSAFTLLEMIIAITVFTIFIGFSIRTYLNFERADQEALLQRHLTFEGQRVLDVLTEAVQTQHIDYSAYVNRGQTDQLQGTELFLRSVDGTRTQHFFWNVPEQRLVVQTTTVGGATETEGLTSSGVEVTALSFTIFPSDDPTSAVNRLNNDLQFQPVVWVDLTLESDGVVRERLVLPLHTAVTTRF